MFAPSSFGWSDKVDEFLDGAKEGGLEVLPTGDLAEYLLPERSRCCVDPQCGDHAFLPGLAFGYIGPAFDADHRRLDCLPDVDEGMPGDENVPVGDLLGDAGFFGAVDEVVEEDAEAAAIIRAKAAYPLGEIVGALELFDDHAFDAKVREILAGAEERATANNRGTLRPHDL